MKQNKIIQTDSTIDKDLNILIKKVSDLSEKIKIIQLNYSKQSALQETALELERMTHKSMQKQLDSFLKQLHTLSNEVKQLKLSLENTTPFYYLKKINMEPGLIGGLSFGIISLICISFSITKN